MFNILGREKLNIRQNSIITVRIPLFPLMAGGENVCEINALFGALKAKGKNYLLLTGRVLVWFTIKTFIFGIIVVILLTNAV